MDLLTSCKVIQQWLYQYFFFVEFKIHGAVVVVEEIYVMLAVVELNCLLTYFHLPTAKHTPTVVQLVVVLLWVDKGNNC